VTVDVDPSNREQVLNVNVLVFDTVPVANGLCITKTGLLFVGSEFGDHLLYQFQVRSLLYPSINMMDKTDRQMKNKIIDN